MPAVHCTALHAAWWAILLIVLGGGGLLLLLVGGAYVYNKFYSSPSVEPDPRSDDGPAPPPDASGDGNGSVRSSFPRCFPLFHHLCFTNFRVLVRVQDY